MRLVDLRDMVANIVDYDPSVDTYRNQITNLLNDAYYSLFSTKPFTFAQKEEIVKAYADVSEASASVTNGSAFVTSLTTEPYFEGQIIEIEGVEYTIAWVATANSVYLTEIYAGPTNIAASAKIKFRYLDLPQDCISIMNVAKRSMTLTPQEPGMFTALARYEDEYYNLPLDEVNLPHYWIPADEYHVVSPKKVGNITNTGVAAPSTDIEIAMSYVYAGRESALSTATVLTADKVDLNITFDVLPNISGYYRKIYIKNNASGYKGFRTIPTGTTFLIDPAATGGPTFAYTLPSFDSAFEFDSDPYTESDGTTQRIRLYPRQDSDYNITVRYMYKPNPLVNDNDTPEFPSSSHQILAYMALKEIFVKLDNLPQANLYERKAAQEMIKLEQRYLTQIPRRFVKRGMVDGRLSPLPLYTPLTHS
jgi:hypothetical protein